MEKIYCTLLVDDDETTNFVNQMLLEDLEVCQQILHANNGKEALDLIIKQCEGQTFPQLILLDINMPVMNGFEFLEAYQKLDFAHKQSVVIVMLTTSMNPEDMNRLKQMPIQGLINKPLTEQKVTDLLREYFR